MCLSCFEYPLLHSSKFAQDFQFSNLFFVNLSVLLRLFFSRICSLYQLHVCALRHDACLERVGGATPTRKEGAKPQRTDPDEHTCALRNERCSVAVLEQRRIGKERLTIEHKKGISAPERPQKYRYVDDLTAGIMHKTYVRATTTLQ